MKQGVAIFQRPVWLEFTAFCSAMLGFLGHVLGLWRLSIGVGIQAKIAVLEWALHTVGPLLGPDSSISASLLQALVIFKGFAATPAWFRFWYHFSGALEFLLSTALFLVGISLWAKKAHAVRFFYFIIIPSIGVHVASICASMVESEGLGILKMMLDLPVLLIKLGLLLVVYFADKRVLGTNTKDLVDLPLD